MRYPTSLSILALALILLSSSAQAAIVDGLTAYWSFDADFAVTEGNPGFDGMPVNGVSIDGNGRFGAAARFERGNNEYMVVGSKVVSQGQDHTYSLWYRADFVDIVGDTRFSLLETTASGAPSDTAAYAVSYSLRDSTGSDIGLMATLADDGTTHSFQVTGGAGAGWHNIIVVYDADNPFSQHFVYLDGILKGDLPTSSLLRETGGLIIGGDRTGASNNWDGWIDDVAFWDRILTPSEIDFIQNNSVGVSFSDATTGPLGDTDLGVGVAWGDYDRDGDLDLYLANRDYPGANKLFQNQGAGVFTDVTSGPLAGDGASTSAVWGDYDNDRDLDLYICVVGPGFNKLLRNDGNGVFADVTSGPVGDYGDGTSMAWGDYDSDGDLDVYLVNFGTAGGSTNRLLRNDGGGVFTDDTHPPVDDDGLGLGVAWGDFEEDGDPDVFLTNYGNNKLFRNDGGLLLDESFSPIDDSGDGAGIGLGDYDNDGDLDVYVANHDGANKLFRNDGYDLYFTDVTSDALGDTSSGNGVAWGDYDNDGDLDLYIANDGQANKLLRNDGGGVFVDATFPPLDDAGNSHGVAWGDYDGDGDLDLYVSNHGQANKLFRNDLLLDHHWLHVDLVGLGSSSSGIGARVRVVTGGVTQTTEVSAGSGYASQNSITAEFGLGHATTVDTLQILWPSGSACTYIQVNDIDQKITVVEDCSGLGTVVGVGSVQVPPLRHHAHPNPSRGGTTIEYVLTRGSPVRLSVFDLRGRRVQVLEDAVQDPGIHRSFWDGRSDSGVLQAAGVYFYRLETKEAAYARKLVRIP